MKSSKISLLFIVTVLLTITVVLILNNQEHEKSIYYNDISLVNYESDSYSYKEKTNFDNTISFKKFNGYQTVYQSQEDQVTLSLSVSIHSGHVKILILSLNGEIKEIINKTQIELMKNDKIKVVAKDASLEITLEPTS